MKSNTWKSAREMGFHDPKAAEKGAESTVSAMVLKELRDENARLREALSAVWNQGVCAGELKDTVQDALWPKGEK